MIRLIPVYLRWDMVRETCILEETVLKILHSPCQSQLKKMFSLRMRSDK